MAYTLGLRQAPKATLKACVGLGLPAAAEGSELSLGREPSYHTVAPRIAVSDLCSTPARRITGKALHDRTVCGAGDPCLFQPSLRSRWCLRGTLT
jgi:hypothetical protein